MFMNNITTNTAEVTIYSDHYQGRTQWYAEEIPSCWQRGPHSPFNRLVVNFPKYIIPLEGERWEVERQRSITGILFVRAKSRKATVADAPDVIMGGVHLNVTDHVSNAGPRWRRHGRLVAANPLHLDGDDFLQVHFDRLTHELIGQDRRQTEVLRDQTLSLCNFRLIDTTWCADCGEHLVLIYQT